MTLLSKFARPSRQPLLFAVQQRRQLSAAAAAQRAQPQVAAKRNFASAQRMSRLELVKRVVLDHHLRLLQNIEIKLKSDE
jgi:hypothetical protein